MAVVVVDFFVLASKTDPISSSYSTHFVKPSIITGLTYADVLRGGVVSRKKKKKTRRKRRRRCALKKVV